MIAIHDRLRTISSYLSNKEAFQLKSLIEKIPLIKDIKSEKHAMKIFMDGLKKLGKDKFLRFLDDLQKFVKGPDMVKLSSVQKEADFQEFVRRYGYPLLIAAGLLIWATKGPGFINDLKSNLEQAQQQQIQQMQDLEELVGK